MIFKSIMKAFWAAIVLATGIAMAPTAVAASNGEKESGRVIGVMFGLNHKSNEYWSHTGMIVRPNLGYRINPQWEVGAFFKYEDLDDHTYSGGLYGDFTAYQFGETGLSLVVEAQASIIAMPREYDSDYALLLAGIPDFPSHSDSNVFFECGFTPGLRYHIPKTPVDIKMRYLFVGYSNNRRWVKADYPGCLGRGDVILDAGLRRLEVGVSLIF